jgi:nitrate reductase gamma subunit
MWEIFSYFVMVPMVYIAFATLVIGIIFKLVVVFRSPGIPGTLAVFPHESSAALGTIGEAFAVPVAFRASKVFWFFIIAYHAAFTLLFLGHLELVDEISVLQIIPHRVFLGAGTVGIVLAVSVAYLFLRRLHTPHREISVPEDYLLLLLLFFAIFFGGILHLADRYGMTALTIPIEDYRKYFSSLLALKPRLPVMITASPHFVIFILHLFFANMVLMLFPFTKMIHAVFVFFALHLKRK